MVMVYGDLIYVEISYVTEGLARNVYNDTRVVPRLVH